MVDNLEAILAVWENKLKFKGGPAYIFSRGDLELRGGAVPAGTPQDTEFLLTRKGGEGG